MAERTTIARPYAEAVFSLATESDALPRWSELLAFYAIAVADPDLAFALGDPRITGEQIDSLLASLLDDISDQEQALLVMLRENGKLQLLPEISDLYKQLRDAAEGTIEASVVSAYAMTKAQVNNLAKILKNELGRDVKIETSIDRSIIGGVIIRAGDTVIDGSVSGSLQNLTSTLTR